jgi:hypothetical protein
MSLISSVFTTVQIAQERYSMCKVCPQFNSTVKMCTNCGCIMPMKVKLRHAECPELNWGPIEDDGQMHFVDDEVWEKLAD